MISSLLKTIALCLISGVTINQPTHSISQISNTTYNGYLTVTDISSYGYTENGGEVGLFFNQHFTDHSGARNDYVVAYRYFDGSSSLNTTTANFQYASYVRYDYESIFNYFVNHDNCTHCFVTLETPSILSGQYYYFVYVFQRIFPFAPIAEIDWPTNNVEMISTLPLNNNLQYDVYFGGISTDYQYLSYLDVGNSNQSFWFAYSWDTEFGALSDSWDMNKPVIMCSPYTYVFHSSASQYNVDFYYLSFSNLMPEGNWQSGYNSGYKTGLKDGESTGYGNGYNDGYQDGLTLSDYGSLGGLFGTIADTPIIMIKSLFNFELFGMNVFVAIMSLLTGLIVLYIVKKII